MEAGILPEVEGVAPARGVRLPGPGQPRNQLGIGVELRQVVEQECHELTGRHVGGQGRVQRSGIVAEEVIQAHPIGPVGAAG